MVLQGASRFTFNSSFGGQNCLSQDSGKQLLLNPLKAVCSRPGLVPLSGQPSGNFHQKRKEAHAEMALRANSQSLKSTAERTRLSQLLCGKWSPVHGRGTSESVQVQQIRAQTDQHTLGLIPHMGTTQAQERDKHQGRQGLSSPSHTFYSSVIRRETGKVSGAMIFNGAMVLVPKH